MPDRVTREVIEEHALAFLNERYELGSPFPIISGAQKIMAQEMTLFTAQFVNKLGIEEE